MHKPEEDETGREGNGHRPAFKAHRRVRPGTIAPVTDALLQGRLFSRFVQKLGFWTNFSSFVILGESWHGAFLRRACLRCEKTFCFVDITSLFATNCAQTFHSVLIAALLLTPLRKNPRAQAPKIDGPLLFTEYSGRHPKNVAISDYRGRGIGCMIEKGILSILRV